MFFNPWGNKSEKKKRTPVAQSTKRAVQNRAGGRCERCNKLIPKGVKEEIHHRNLNPTQNNIGNLRLLCPNCHSAIHNNQRKRKKPSNEGFGFPDFSQL
ncbi:MAG: HNH endonuclease [Nitrososphaerota archaeon]|jgi:5-methylcytosine-specific restriction endonuclease McrA|nr:HNH endonuclease [Nitrososphaerota archaeon]